MALAVPTPQEIISLSDERWVEEYIITVRFQRGERLSEWFNQHSMLDFLLDDNYAAVFSRALPAEQYDETLKVQNLVKDGLDEVARLTAESRGSLFLSTVGAGVEDSDSSRLVGAIADTIHLANHDDRLAQRFALDLYGTGFAAMLHYQEDGFPYVRHLRWDPRHCYPNVIEDRLLDLIHIRALKRHQAARMYPKLELDLMTDASDDVEVVDYVSPEVIVKAVIVNRNAQPGKNGREPTSEPRAYIVEDKTGENTLGVIPVSWAKWDTGNSKFICPALAPRGQVNLMNRLATLVTDNMEQIVYSSLLAVGVEDPEAYGPLSVHVGNVENGVPPRMERVAPAPLQNGVFAFMNFLEHGARGSAAFPQSRQGEGLGSIYSAPGVSQGQGQQSTLVRAVQRGLGAMRERGIEIDFKMERNVPELNREKPLFRPAGNTKTYTPSKDIPETFYAEFKWGFGAGLDPVNRIVAANTSVASKILSRQSARAGNPDIGDTGQEEILVWREQTADLIMEKALADPDPMYGFMIAEALEQGKTPLQVAGALRTYREQQQQLVLAQQQAAAGGVTNQMTPEQAAGQVKSLQKGGIPGNADLLQGAANPTGAPGAPPAPLPQPQFAPPPYAVVGTQARTQGGGG